LDLKLEEFLKEQINHYIIKFTVKNQKKKKRFYNIGAGNFFHPYWTNIDYASDWYEKVQKANFINHNLFDKGSLPIEDNVAEIVYSSHTLEHIDDESAEVILKEAYRILKPKGMLRLTLPNVELDFQALKQKDRSFYYWIPRYSKKIEMERVRIHKPMTEVSIHQIFLFHVASQRSQLHEYKSSFQLSDDELEQKLNTLNFNEFFNDLISKCDKDIQLQYPGNHINWWNYEKVIKFLKKVGFNKFIFSGKGQSISPVMRNTSLFDSTHPKISLYIEAIKE